MEHEHFSGKRVTTLGLSSVPLVVKVPYFGENTILSIFISSSAWDMCMLT